AHILHLNPAVYVVHGEIADHIAHAHPSHVHGSELQIDTAWDLQLKIHLDHVPTAAVPSTTTAIAVAIAIATERTVYVELQQVRLIGDIERDFLLGGLHSFLGLGANRLVDHQLHLI